jgi:osmotically-inducible protein OsmY
MTDREIQRRVQDAFDHECAVNTATIGVAVRQGVVTLHGTVATLQESWAAERVARHVPDVKAVANDIEVSSARRIARTDAAISRAIVNTLAWQTAVPPDAVHAVVREGWVVLSGRVTHQEQKLAAERSVRLLYGVKGVFSEITVQPPPPQHGRNSVA